MILSWFRARSIAPAIVKLPTPEVSLVLQQAVQQAVAQQQAGQLDVAETLYRRILHDAPHQFDALHMLGVVALQRGRLSEAETLIRNALDVDPQHVAAHFNLAMVLRQSGRPTDAIVPLKRAFALDPTSAEVCSLLGASLLDVGDKTAAREALIQAAQLAPDNAIPHNNLGAFLKGIGELAGAVTSLSRAVAIDPTMLPALQNLALTHFALGNIEACLDIYARLVKLPGVDASTHYAYGNALMTAGHASHAVQRYQCAIDLEPDNAQARWAMVMAHWRPIYDDVKGIEAARMAFTDAISALDTWFTPERAALGAAAVGSTQPFYLAYQEYDNSAMLRSYGRLCTRLMQPVAAAAKARFVRSPPSTGRKLRVGVVSAHVHYHSVWNAITKGWITHLDPTRFEVHVFHVGLSADGETARARSEATDFVDTPRTLEGWTQAILDAELDVLIYPDVGMDSLTTQLAAQRLVPVQAAGWGHPDTTGLPTIDLFLSATLFEPADGEAHYTERLVRLPNLGVFVDRLTPVAVAPDLSALGLPQSEALLLCPGQLFKYSPEHDDVWVKLGARLRAQGEGRLVFFRGPRVEIAAQFERRLRRAFEGSGVDFDRTVCFVPVLPVAQFYGLMQHATLMLDSIGFSGFNTALQGLECGLPVVAYEGEFMRGRLASGLLRRAGLDDWVATSHAEFIDKAMKLVVDEPRRLELRQQIAQRCELLFHDLEPVRALEQVLVNAVASAAI